MQMNAMQVTRHGGPEVLALAELPRPEPGPGEALVQVQAASVNPIDWKMRQGAYKRPTPYVPGADFCGTVAALGAGAEGFRVGDEVIGSLPGAAGADAEFLTAPVKLLAPKPRTLSAVEAAAVPMAALTAWQGLFDGLQVRAGERLLITGASGGVGTFAVQLARWVGALVVATASTDDVEFVNALGAAEVIDYERQRIDDAARARGIDCCLDLVGGEVQRQALAVLRRGGRLISTVEPPDTGPLLERGLTGRMIVMKPDGDQLRQIGRRIDDGFIKPYVGRTLPFERAAEAEELNRRREVTGKIVLTVGNA